MTQVKDTITVLHGNPEHGGIRFTVILMLLLGLWLGFRVTFSLVRLVGEDRLLDYAFILSCLGAVPVAIFLIWSVETVLKRIWPSGTRVLLEHNPHPVGTSPQKLRVSRKNATAQTFAWTENLAFTNWFFRLSGYPRGGRERRLPKDWLCLACELRQGEAQTAFYSYMKPGQAQPLLESDRGPFRFHQIFPAELYDTSLRARLSPPSRPELPTHVIRGEHGRFWLAERRRWQSGIELSPRDFAALMAFITDPAESGAVTSG